MDAITRPLTVQALMAQDGTVSQIGPGEVAHFNGPGFVWLHIEGATRASLADLPDYVPQMAGNALLASETRPRCDEVDEAALINLRGTAADRFARMAEELEAVRERAALLHEQLTDLRAEKMDQRSLAIAVTAFIFLPLTFVTGLLGMNVEGIPYAEESWAFWGVVGFCGVIALAVMGWFAKRQWLDN